jgi:hypothetical protein
MPTHGLTLNASSVSPETARIGTQAKEGYRKDRYFQGMIDEVAIYPRALVEDEIETLRRMGLEHKPLAEVPR